MNNQINDGGTAFPYKREFRSNGAVIDYEMETGMTLRDYFAAAALQGLLASNEKGNSNFFSETSYRLADAMLRAREVKP